MLENRIQADILLGIGALPGVRVFRNTVGEAWYGQILERNPTTLLLGNPRHVTFGLAPGSSDLIGWREVLITPDMVGERVALFLAAEVKTASGRTKRSQDAFIAAVTAAGGIAGVVRNPADARRLVS